MNGRRKEGIVLGASSRSSFFREEKEGGRI
jgi:hypothetical protein